MKDLLTRFMTDEAGSATMEYGLMVLYLSLAVLSSMNAAGKQLNSELAAADTSLH
jgi:Flp pilus assembly pilin Flp